MREVQPGDELVEAEVDKNGNRDRDTGGFFVERSPAAMWRPVFVGLGYARKKNGKFPKEAKSWKLPAKSHDEVNE